MFRVTGWSWSCNRKGNGSKYIIFIFIFMSDYLKYIYFKLFSTKKTNGGILHSFWANILRKQNHDSVGSKI